MVRLKPKAVYKGNTRNKDENMTHKDLIAAATDPRQEYWSGLPPARHRDKRLTLDTPGVREFLASGKRYPKYAFGRGGKRIYMFFGL